MMIVWKNLKQLMNRKGDRMKLETIKEEEFRIFLNNHPQKTFMQTPEIGKLREKNGWKVVYLGMRDNHKLIAATMLLSKKRYFGKSEFYALRGPLLDYENKTIVNIFFQNLFDYVKKNRGYVLRIDPYVVYKERNGVGEIIEDGVDHTAVTKQLCSLGFQKVEKKQEEQVSWMYVLDTANKTEEEILKNMQQTTRNVIRKTLKYGIEIKELEREELTQFYDIMSQTGKRKGFSIRSLSYYENMYDVFAPRGEIKYLVTKLNMKKHLSILEDDKKEKERELETILEKKNGEGRKKAILEAIYGIDKRIAKAKEILKEAGEEITLSGSMFVMTQPEIIYLSSGNYEEYLMYNSQYLIQWEMIRYALKNNYKRYNFYGIPSTFDKKDKDYGIYEFKTGFNGYVEQLIGEYEKPISFSYYILKFIHKIKK